MPVWTLTSIPSYYGRLADIESRYFIFFFMLLDAEVKIIEHATTYIIRMTMTLYGRLADIQSSYSIILMLLDAKVKIIKHAEQLLSGWPWLSMVRSGPLADIGLDI